MIYPYLPDSGFWKNKRVLVTGGAGFLGREICTRLKNYGAKVFVPRKTDFDFVQMSRTQACMRQFKPQIVIHSAAYYGGLGITLAEPGRIYYENLVMGANLMEAARQANVEKFVSIGTACGYPGHLEDHLKESDLWAGPPHDSVIAYGAVKKMLAVQGLAYHRQYGFTAIHLIPSNLYGPFDAYDDYRSHAVAALIKKFCVAHANAEPVRVWGTGVAIREFIYVEDCADGVILAAEKYDDVKPLNIGTGQGTSIRELVVTIAQLLDFKDEIHWDTSKPDGQLVKVLDIKRMQNALNWVPRVKLQEGLRKTITWYIENYLPELTLPANLDATVEKTA